MSVARTARRRRKQAAMGRRGLEQVFGKSAAPKYPGVVSKEKSQRKLANQINKIKTIALRKGSKK